MTTFSLNLDLAGHEHPHSPTAQRHIVRQLLDRAAQAIGSGEATEGEIIHGEAFQQKKVGTWKFSDGE